jgi:nucleoid-associated protein YgaU
MLLALLAALLAPLQEVTVVPPDPKPGYTLLWHKVAPGETLEGLSEKLSGNWTLWEENWKFNPQLENPHKLVPGQRIRILVPGEAETAEIKQLAQRVEEQPHPDVAWTKANLGDRLKERDGLRTYERSSAELAFPDGSRLVVTEESMVFLRQMGGTLTAVPQRRSLEVVEGQADVETRRLAEKPAADIEVIVGGARARPRAGDTEATQTRARRGRAGVAQVMVFSGTSEVEAGGKSVEVGAGMGTAVPKGGAPTEPEKLLPAPRLRLPEENAALDYSNPRFVWHPLPKATSYTIEVCRDLECTQLVDRASGLEQAEWTAEDLPLGELHWRVTAVAASGLDGFASAPRPLSVRSLWRRPAQPRRR